MRSVIGMVIRIAFWIIMLIAVFGAMVALVVHLSAINIPHIIDAIDDVFPSTTVSVGGLLYVVASLGALLLAVLTVYLPLVRILAEMDRANIARRNATTQNNR